MVKKAKHVFASHNQPRMPLNDNYYYLSNSRVLNWQSKIVKKMALMHFAFITTGLMEDRFKKTVKNIYFIKMDIDGYDLESLRAVENLIKK